MEEKLAFVQLFHPGQEQSCERWNTVKENHKRRFVKTYGSYLEDKRVHEGDLTFWCEWEPEAKKIKSRIHATNDKPKYLWQPFYSLHQKNSKSKNTDPFVFGDRFYYVCCQQWKNDRPTQLRFLEKGSIILFGSHLNESFVLDTVFVVGDYQNIKFQDYPLKSVPQVYNDVTLSLIFSSSSNNSCNFSKEPEKCVASEFRLYIGASYSNPYKEMFSFFPCLPYTEENFGFKRPAIAINGVISQKQKQGYKYEHQPSMPTSIQDNYKLWKEVKHQVESQGLKLGVYAELPSKPD